MNMNTSHDTLLQPFATHDKLSNIKRSESFAGNNVFKELWQKECILHRINCCN